VAATPFAAGFSPALPGVAAAPFGLEQKTWFRSPAVFRRTPLLELLAAVCWVSSLRAWQPFLRDRGPGGLACKALSASGANIRFDVSDVSIFERVFGFLLQEVELA